jgi:hypothetical protein
MDANQDDKLRREARVTGLGPRQPDPAALAGWQSRLGSASVMVHAGWILMVAAFVVAVAAAMPKNVGDHGRAFTNGLQMGQSPLFMLGFFGGLTLLVVGLVKKSTARREIARIMDTTAGVMAAATRVPPGAPLGQPSLEPPVVDDADRVRRQQLRSRGAWYLGIGGAIVLASIIGMVMGFSGGGASVARNAQRIMTSLGIAFFPFVLGMIFVIKGALMRSNNQA